MNADIDIIYQVDDPIGLLRPLTQAGRNWLIDNIKGPRINNSAAVSAPAELLEVIGKLTGAGITANWTNE